MDSRYSLPVRVISVVVMTCFLWTFGGIFDIAWAVKKSEELKVTGPVEKAEGPEERFGRAVSDMVQAVKEVRASKSEEERRAAKERLRTS